MITNEIEKLKHGIVEKFNPAKILLFGSHAKNSASKDSDIDICIVADVDDKKDFRKKITMFIYDDIEGLDFDKPVDVLLYTTEEWDQYSKQNGSFANAISREGVVLHGCQTENFAVSGYPPLQTLRYRV
ncbi:DNA polymerase beta domain-containing protein region [Thermincola ferriacetica]|uniref:DNA polymerase beta domain-containing protein region n=1 Tax=Thermincola ferriacetica TaxID=281456 RepID=A0A0L6VYG1_9FIRM|nr:nucleotidyltransferase domain-containing protein [Thermincola ferriacetica]KNZ68193.1 DNA polymerase beta domain-containing protein region [Thermincola ferriacetica]